MTEREAVREDQVFLDAQALELRQAMEEAKNMLTGMTLSITTQLNTSTQSLNVQYIDLGDYEARMIRIADMLHGASRRTFKARIDYYAKVS